MFLRDVGLKKFFLTIKMKEEKAKSSSIINYDFDEFGKKIV